MGTKMHRLPQVLKRAISHWARVLLMKWSCGCPALACHPPLKPSSPPISLMSPASATGSGGNSPPSEPNEGEEFQEIHSQTPGKLNRGRCLLGPRHVDLSCTFLRKRNGHGRAMAESREEDDRRESLALVNVTRI